jgi:signal transduction histidine kinase
VVADWVMIAIEKRIDLGFESAGPAMITGNPFLLRELAKNLIDNALRYTAAGGHVCRVNANPDTVLFEVEDDGIGITEEQAELVFERFYRVDDATTEGSGLGLAIVQEIAMQHDSRASLRPNPAARAPSPVSRLPPGARLLPRPRCRMTSPSCIANRRQSVPDRASNMQCPKFAAKCCEAGHAPL